MLGWTPLTVMREACLQDLCDAYAGFIAFDSKNIAPGLDTSFLPDTSFLNDMMKKSPDLKGNK